MMNKFSLPGARKAAAVYHSLVWAIFISYELLCIVATVGIGGAYWPYLFYYCLYIALFYVNAHVILDFSFFRTGTPYLVATLLIIVEILVFGFSKAMLDRLLAGGNGPWIMPAFFTKSYVLSNIFRQIFFIGFSIAYWAMLYLNRFRYEAQRLEIERLKQQALSLELENRYILVENAYLQNQISPHLLFNSLNFIYYAVYQFSDRAGKGIMLLADLLRYSLSAGGPRRKMTTLEQEVAQILNLIELDRMRFKEKRYLKFSQQGEIGDKFILPLALLTLVENVVKHGDCSDPVNPASAELLIEENKLTFRTVNNKRETAAFENTGLGLNNLRKRLQNTYGDRFAFDTTEENDRFTTHLTIEL